jgi:hypothetical protein
LSPYLKGTSEAEGLDIQPPPLDGRGGLFRRRGWDSQLSNPSPSRVLSFIKREE